MPLLVRVYAPNAPPGPRPPYRADDPSTFLSLLSAATSLGMDVPTALIEEGRRLLEQGVTPSPGVATGWRGDVPARMETAVVDAMHPEIRGDAFCGAGS
jgi:hypothetical protein